MFSFGLTMLSPGFKDHLRNLQYQAREAFFWTVNQGCPRDSPKHHRLWLLYLCAPQRWNMSLIAEDTMHFKPVAQRLLSSNWPDRKCMQTSKGLKTPTSIYSALMSRTQRQPARHDHPKGAVETLTNSCLIGFKACSTEGKPRLVLET